MPNPTYLDCEARFFSRATGLRLAVNPDETLSLAWELVESGGTGQITCELAHAFDDVTWPVQGGDILEIWVQGTGEAVPRCRGRVGHYDKTLDKTEKFLLTGYGRMEDMNHVLFDRILLVPGGADLADFAGQIADDYAQRRPDLRFVRDIQQTGVSLERLDQTDTTARAGMDALQAQSGGNVVWGWDIDPQTGLDRFYLRPKVAVAGSQFFVGGNVKLVSSPSELQGIVNAMKVEGGPAKFPQLMTNPSFEVPSLPDAATGSLLINGGFENGTHGSIDPNNGDSAGGNQDILGWSERGGATRNAHDPATNHNSSAHTGDWYVILDQAGKEVWQEVPVTPGTLTYGASLFCAREKGSFAAEGTLIVEGRSGPGGAVLETFSLPLQPASTAWTGGQPTTALSSDGLSLNVQFANSQTTTARLRIIAGINGAGIGGNTHGLLLDDVTFADVTAVGQTGWSTHLQNPGSAANKFLSLDWACRAAAWDGFYGLRVNVLADGSDKPAIAPAPGDLTSGNGFHYKPGPQQAIRTGFRVRMSPGLSAGAGTVFVEYREWASDGHQTQFQFQSFTIPNDGQWHFCFLDISAHGDVDTATTQATLGASGWYDFDGFTARDAQAGEGGTPSDPLGVQTFLRGANFEIYVTAEQVCTSTSAADTLAAASASLYGRQEDIVKNDQIIDWNPDSVQWAAAYFGRVAVPIDRPQVQLDHEPQQMPSPGSGKQVRVSGMKADVQGKDLQDWCAKAAYTFAKMKLSVALDLDSTRPTWAKLLLNIGAGGGGKSAGAIAAVAGGGGGTSTPSAAPVTSVAGRTGAITLAAADVAGLGTAALADLPAAGSNASAVQAVRGDDTRLTGAGPGGAAAPATAAALGTVETDITETGGSVVYTKTTMDSLLAGKISVGAALAESEITGLLSDLGTKITVGAALPESEISDLVSDLAGKIGAGTALPESEITGLLSDLAGKMATGAAIPESEITNLAADLAARLVVAGTPAALGQVPVVTGISPLAVQWQTPPGGTVTSVAGRTGAVTLSTSDISGLGTAALTDLPAAGRDAAAGQVVRGDDTRLGAVTSGRLAGYIFGRPGALITGLSATPYTCPPGANLTLVGFRVSLAVAGTSDTTLRLSKSAGTGAVSSTTGFSANATSQIVTVSAGNKASNTDTISTAFALTGNDQVDVNVTSAGTGAAGLIVEAIWTY